MVWVEPETVELVTTSEAADLSEFEAFVELKTGEAYLSIWCHGKYQTSLRG